MKNLLLEKYIKVAVKKALKEQEEQIKKQQKSVYLIYKFPGLKQAMMDLMSPAFPKFVSDVQIIAPKPTTFNIFLINGMNFYLSYLGKGRYIAKIQGKRYNLINLGETQRAGQAIANILEFSFNPTVENTPKQPKVNNEIPSGGGTGTFPGDEISPTGNEDELAADIAALDSEPEEISPEDSEENEDNIIP